MFVGLRYTSKLKLVSFLCIITSKNGRVWFCSISTVNLIDVESEFNECRMESRSSEGLIKENTSSTYLNQVLGWNRGMVGINLVS